MKKNKYWFRPKTYGYGMTPSSWEGWLLTFSFTLIIVSLSFFHTHVQDVLPLLQSMGFLYIEILGLTFLLIRFAKTKMKEALKWRWGKKEKNKRPFC